MKKLFTILLLASVAFATEGAKSIIAVEYTYLGATTQSIGVKLGAEENDYRLFLSYRALDITTATIGHSGGIELDYLFRLGKAFGIYAGMVGGYQSSSSINSLYGGADAGVVVSLANLEVDTGLRYWYYLGATQPYTGSEALSYYVALHYFY